MPTPPQEQTIAVHDQEDTNMLAGAVLRALEEEGMGVGVRTTTPLQWW